MTLPLADNVHRKLAALGPEGAAWLDALPRTLDEVLSSWGLELGEAMTGGSTAFAACVTTPDGTEAVLKLAIPDDPTAAFARELQALRAAGGKGFVELLRVDEPRRAMLLERLGRPIADLGLPVEEQLDAIVDALAAAWRPGASFAGWYGGDEQARSLAAFVERAWREQGRPCVPEVVTVAVRAAERRAASVAAAPRVTIHGDAHPQNVLEVPGAPGRFKLIDPEPMVSEPAHDLAIPLRDWSTELSDHAGAERLAAWCARVAERSGVEEDAIWEWAFLERVASGLYLLELGDDEGRCFLEVAEALVG